jgi:WD40 repeat protein
MQVFELPERPTGPGFPIDSGPLVLPDSIAFSPGGRRLAMWERGAVYVVDTLAGTVRTLEGVGGESHVEVSGVGFTADGSSLVADRRRRVGRVERVVVYDVETGAVVRVSPFKPDGAAQPGPGGRLVYESVSVGSYTEVAAWDPLTGETKSRFGRHKGRLRQLAFSADGKRMAGSGNTVIRIWDIGGPTPPARAARRFDLERHVVVSALALSTDGAFLAASGSHLGTQVWDVTTGERWEPVTASTAFVHNIAFHPSRPLLVCACEEEREVAFWDVVSRTEVKRFAWDWGSAAARVPEWEPFGPKVAVCFSPDGLRCAAASAGQVVVWDVDV